MAEEPGADEVVVHDGFTRGGEGAIDFAQAVERASRRPAYRKIDIDDEGRTVGLY